MGRTVAPVAADSAANGCSPTNWRNAGQFEVRSPPSFTGFVDREAIAGTNHLQRIHILNIIFSTIAIESPPARWLNRTASSGIQVVWFPLRSDAGG